MRALIRNIVIVVAVMFVAVWSILPPEKKLRLGRDLRGGVSLVYSVQVKPGDPPDVVSRVMDVIRNRVDPNGLSEIAINQQGRDRIEITMPLPNDRVKRLKAEYEAALASLASSTIEPSQFERVMREQGAEREADIASLAGGDAQRAAALKAAAETSDAARAAREQYDAAKAELRTATTAGADQARLGELQAKVNDLASKTADAELAYDAARGKAMSASISPDEVRQAIEASDESRTLTDERTGQRETLPSTREQKLDDLFKRYPEKKPQIERAIAAFEKYAAERTRLDDPADLKRLLAGAGVLDFRITVKPNDATVQISRLRRELHERGPRNVQSTQARWYKINKIDTWFDTVQSLQALKADPAGYFASARGVVVEEYEGDYYMLCWDTPGNRLTRAEGEWAVSGAYPSTDPQRGTPAISFEMNNRGASLLGQLTERHVQDQMAVLLDDQVYTAPTLQSKISKSGQITGQFSDPEIRYIVRVLSAGSLQAKLSPEPISEVTLAPELGSDNLRAGLYAGVISLVVISVFMIFYYFGCGVISVFALLCNAVLILGIMALNSAAFTMPGIAGVILTFGMAVDANVLIYERMREEILRGADLRTAVRLGYSKALASIVDGNVTNLIHCVVLYFVGTQEIKGFAITMGIGVLTTLFSALFISHIIFNLLVDHGPWRRASMLPLKFPAIDRFFHRNINWLGLRWVFWSFSAAYVALGLGMAVFRGTEMLDTQFRGGTQIVFKLRPQVDASGQPVLDANGNAERITLTRKDVEKRLQSLGENAGNNEQLKMLAESSVLPVNPRSDGVTSDQFTIKSLATDPRTVNDAIARAFEGVLETQPAVTFKGDRAAGVKAAPVYQIVSGRLGEDIQRPAYNDDIKAFLGGVAVVVEDITPPQPLSALRDRLERTRQTQAFSDTLSRERRYIVLEGDERAVKTLAILVRDPSASVFDDMNRWTTDVAAREWALTKAALTTSSTSASVEVFSPTIARTFTAQAIVALVLGFILVGIYIWVRFGAISYALAGVIPLIHDVLTAIGFIALAQIIYEKESLQPIAHALGIRPFKIDLNMVAALLTIVGYSLNDTVIVMDRIRENRGKSPYVTADMINSAVNMTISRTVITSGTVLMAAIVLYVFGGEGMRGFAYALVIGVAVGTYSSIAIAAPIVWTRHPNVAPPTDKPRTAAQPSVPARV